MKRILFSPVGSTDPIAGQRDGALLHIARCFDIDEVYLFLSKEMCELDEKDDRYIYCLDRLKEHTGKSFDVHKILRPALEEVQVFDTIFSEFRSIVERITAEMGKEDELYLNISSGTPAMKSALQVIATVAEHKLVPIQVSTPSKAYNEHREDVKGDYDVELQWEMNLDNEPEFEARWSVSSNVNLAAEIKKNIIKKLAESYDYVAALEIAEEMDAFIDERALNLLRAAASRMKLDKNKATLLLKNTGYKMFPHEMGSECGIFECLALCRIKIIKEEYTDFLRNISPLFFALLERIAAKELGIALEDFYDVRKGLNGTFFKAWDIERVERDAVLTNILTRNGRYELRKQVVTTAHLVELINAKSSNGKLKEVIMRIRRVEEDIRNPVAHCITYITEDVIKMATGMSAIAIFKALKTLTIFSGIKVTEEDLLTYEKCNQEIIRLL